MINTSIENDVADQPLLLIIWPQWFELWTGPRGESFDSLQPLATLISRYRSVRFEMTLMGALSTSVVPADLEEFCLHIVETGSTSEVFEAALRFLRLMGITNRSEVLERAFLENRCDATESTDGVLALENAGVLSEQVTETFAAKILATEDLQDIPRGSLGVIARHGGPDERTTVIRVVEKLLQDAESEEWGGSLPTDLGEVFLGLSDNGEDVKTPLKTLLSIEGIPTCSGFLRTIFRLAARVGAEIPFRTMAQQGNREIGTELFRMILRAPSEFLGYRDSLGEAIDEFCEQDNTLGALAITAYSRLGGDRSIVEAYCAADKWQCRIGAYWGLFPNVDKDSLQSFHEKEKDDDARAVLVYLLAVVDGKEPASIFFDLFESDYATVNEILRYDSVIPVFRHSRFGIMREVTNDFGRNLTGQELSMVIGTGSSVDVFSGNWIGTDYENTFIALANRAGITTRKTAELLLTEATEEQDLKNAAIALAALGGPLTEGGETLVRLLSYRNPPRWIDESRFSYVEHLVYGPDEDLASMVVQSMERSLLSRRPFLLQRLWDMSIDDAVPLLMEILPDVVVPSIFTDTIQQLSRSYSTGRETLAPFTRRESSNSSAGRIALGPQRLGNVPLAFELDAIASDFHDGNASMVRQFAEKAGVSVIHLIETLAGRYEWKLRQAAMAEVRDRPSPEYLDQVLAILKKEADSDVMETAVAAFRRLAASFPDLLRGVRILTNTDADGDWNTSDDWEVVFDAYNKTVFQETELAEYVGRRLIIEPVTDTAVSPGTLTKEQWDGLACHLSIEYQEESSGHILAVVSEAMSAEIFGMLLNGKMARAFVGRWS